MSKRSATPTPKSRPGRQAVIDLKVVEGMAAVGASNVEIADFLNLDEGTIRRRCAQLLIKARASLKTRLRQAQLKAALSGNPAMLIWLGKQLLDQADQQRIRVGELEAMTDAQLQALADGTAPK